MVLWSLNLHPCLESWSRIGPRLAYIHVGKSFLFIRNNRYEDNVEQILMNIEQTIYQETSFFKWRYFCVFKGSAVFLWSKEFYTTRKCHEEFSIEALIYPIFSIARARLSFPDQSWCPQRSRNKCSWHFTRITQHPRKTLS